MIFIVFSAIYLFKPVLRKKIDPMSLSWTLYDKKHIPDSHECERNNVNIFNEYVLPPLVLKKRSFECFKIHQITIDIPSSQAIRRYTRFSMHVWFIHLIGHYRKYGGHSVQNVFLLQYIIRPIKIGEFAFYTFILWKTSVRRTCIIEIHFVDTMCARY
jgi:hypothetical protein